jgi:DNA gyrase subunit A
LYGNKTVQGIRNINDESDQDGIRIVIDLKRDTDGVVVLNQLYKHSRLRISFGLNLLALVDNQPTLLGLKDFLQHHISHRQDVIRRRTEYDLEQARKRLHILDGLLVALTNIDDVITGIRRSRTVEDARSFLIGTYSLSEEQAKAILEMRLQKLAALEQDKVKDEHAELEKDVKEYLDILANEQRVLNIIKQELEEIKTNYGDSRRSTITNAEDDDIDLEDLIEEDTVVVTMSHAGYVKRLPLDTYKTQKRGGKGVIAAGTKEEDFVERLYVTSTHDYLLFFTNQGQVFWQKVYHLPEGSRQSKGKHVSNVLELRSGEKITAIVPVRTFEEGYLFMATRHGTVKKTSLQDFSRPRKGGIRAITIDDDDELIGVKYTDGNNEILLATCQGMANRFREGDVRAMGRTARGVRGIRLGENDDVIGMLAADEGMKLLTITENGYGKRTNVSEYRLCNRGGKGVTNIKITEKNGNVKAVMLVDGSEDLMLVSREGIGIRMKCGSISVIGRATQGVRVMRLNDGDKVAAAAKIVNEDDEPENVTEKDVPPIKTLPVVERSHDVENDDIVEDDEPEKVHEQPISYREDGVQEGEQNVIEELLEQVPPDTESDNADSTSVGTEEDHSEEDHSEKQFF